MFYWQDIRYTFRLLAKNPLFTILTVVVLAGGLGLSIFTFSFLHTAMLKPLPLQDGSTILRLLMLMLMLVGQGGRQLGVGALVALPLTLLVGWGFSRFFPISLFVSMGTALLVSAVITALVLTATRFPTRRAIAIEPRDALWRE